MVERLRGHHFWVVSFFVVVFPRGSGKKAAAVLLVVAHGRRASERQKWRSALPHFSYPADAE